MTAAGVDAILKIASLDKKRKLEHHSPLNQPHNAEEKKDTQQRKRNRQIYTNENIKKKKVPSKQVPSSVPQIPRTPKSDTKKLKISSSNVTLSQLHGNNSKEEEYVLPFGPAPKSCNITENTFQYILTNQFILENELKKLKEDVSFNFKKILETLEQKMASIPATVI